MFFYRFTISYDGRPYQGWQSQPHQQTVQDTFDRVLAALGFQIPSLAAGRTDAGVHALGQVVRASSAQSWRPESLTKALNAQLPSTIRVQASALMPENFHPLKNAGKEYRYFWAAEVAPFCQGLLTAYDYPLDLVAMQKAAAALVGQHDFAPFACRGTPAKSTIREIFAVQLKTHSFPFSPSTPTSLSSVDSLPWIKGDYYQFSIIGSGFLKQMVRLIMGGLMNVGRGKVSLALWQEVLAGDYRHLAALDLAAARSLPSMASSPASADEATEIASPTWPYPRLGPVAPADGLYLAQVFFTQEERDARVAQLQDCEGDLGC